MIAALTQLLIFQLIGETIVRLLQWPVPGPVLGMLLLFGMLSLRGGPSESLRTTCQQLLQHMSLLFVPAGSGIMLHMHLVKNEWLPLIASLTISTFAALLITAGLMHWLTRGRHA